MTTTKVRYNQIKTGLPAGGDVNYNDVSVLLLMNGANGSTVFTDSSNSSLSNSFLGVNISTAESKFGGTSAYFDGGDYLQMSSSGFDFGTGDFTIEFWQKMNSTSIAVNNQYGILQTSDQVGGFKTSYTSGILVAFGVNGNGSITTNAAGTSITSSAGVLTADSWEHVAVTRYNGTVKIFINGTQVATGSVTGVISGENLVVGGYYSAAWTSTGYVDNFRITKGVARYTSNFSVPTAAFPAFESKEGKELRVGANGTIELES